MSCIALDMTAPGRQGACSSSCSLSCILCVEPLASHGERWYRPVKYRIFISVLPRSCGKTESYVGMALTPMYPTAVLMTLRMIFHKEGLSSFCIPWGILSLFRSIHGQGHCARYCPLRETGASIFCPWSFALFGIMRSSKWRVPVGQHSSFVGRARVGKVGVCLDLYTQLFQYRKHCSRNGAC